MKIYDRCFPCFEKQLETALKNIDKSLYGEIRKEQDLRIDKLKII